VAWRDYLKNPAVQGSDLVQVEPLGKCDDAGINGLESQGWVRGEQLGHPPVVMRGHLDDPELVISDGGAEFGSQADASVPLRVGQQMTDLGNGNRGSNEGTSPRAPAGRPPPPSSLRSPPR
jgi:hypothetical protein